MPLHLTLRQIEYTITAAECGSMTRAADVLGVSQPTISQAISQLEKQLGHAVFNRLGNGRLEPTAFGLGVIDQARGLLDQARALERLGTEAAPLGGEVRLGIYTHLAPLHLARLLKAAGTSLPGIHVRVMEAMFQQLVDDLERGLADLSLTYDLGLGPDIAAQALSESAPRLLLPADHRHAGARTLRLEDVADDPLILTGQAMSAVSIEQMFEAAGIRPRIAHRVASFETLRSMVAHGMGVAVTFLEHAHDFSADGLELRSVPIAGDVVRHRLVLASRKGARLTPAARALRDLIVADRPRARGKDAARRDLGRVAVSRRAERSVG